MGRASKGRYKVYVEYSKVLKIVVVFNFFVAPQKEQKDLPAFRT
jgi:hypothetical protein